MHASSGKLQHKLREGAETSAVASEAATRGTQMVRMPSRGVAALFIVGTGMVGVVFYVHRLQTLERKVMAPPSRRTPAPKTLYPHCAHARARALRFASADDAASGSARHREARSVGLAGDLFV